MQIELIRADITSMKVDAMVNPSDSPFDDTPGGNVLCKFVINVPVTHPGSVDDEDALRQATERALQRAEELAVSSVAMPAMWSGDEKITERCARVMLATTARFGERARSLKRVIYALFGQAVYDVFHRVLGETRR